jgi:putative two-component system response regulator
MEGIDGMQLTNLYDARILIVDDQEANVHLLGKILRRAGYINTVSTTDPRDVLSLCVQQPPDLILLDLMMAHLDGFEVMEQIKPLLEGTYLPVLVLTADITSETREKALASGAKDFLTKPFDPTEVLLRIGNLLQTRALHLQLKDQNRLLEERVRERTAELERARLEILKRLAVAAEYRDDATGQHTRRVSRLCAHLAHAMGLADNHVELIREASPLHDVGKIGIPDAILLKPARLTDEEFEVIKTHTTIGAGILSEGTSDCILMAEQIALTHHERWDGSGYPLGLAGEDIPMEGRIVAIIDVFDALVHERPYKRAWPLEEALAEVERQSGSQFDPHIANVFLDVQRHDISQY